MTKRTHYRDNQVAALQRIEERRRSLDATQEDLCLAADLTVRTYRRMTKSGLAWPRQIRALRYALRTIEQRQRTAKAMFEDAP